MKIVSPFGFRIISLVFHVDCRCLRLNGRPMYCRVCLRGHNWIHFRPGGGGYSGQNRTWMCLPNLKKSDFLYTNFSPNYPPIGVPFSIEKHLILPKLGAFYHIICSKYTQFLNLGSFVSDENPPIAIPNFAKKHPKRQAHRPIRIPCQCESPPPPGHFRP